LSRNNLAAWKIVWNPVPGTRWRGGPARCRRSPGRRSAIQFSKRRAGPVPRVQKEEARFSPHRRPTGPACQVRHRSREKVQRADEKGRRRARRAGARRRRRQEFAPPRSAGQARESLPGPVSGRLPHGFSCQRTARPFSGRPRELSSVVGSLSCAREEFHDSQKTFSASSHRFSSAFSAFPAMRKGFSLTLCPFRGSFAAFP
jgi:hypothetical protein